MCISSSTRIVLASRQRFFRQKPRVSEHKIFIIIINRKDIPVRKNLNPAHNQ